VFDEREMVNLVDSALEFWLTYGKYSEEFETKLAEFLMVKYCAMVNSGSSANLLAFMTLTSPLLGERGIRRGDEVLTVAAAFPTTIAPIVQFGAVPVFVDVDLQTLNVNTSLLEEAYSKKMKAVILAHTLGNPFNIKAVKEFCVKHGLWLIEDNCDALGAKYDGKYTGTWGDIGTSSFYPPHHITMGEGGAVYTNNLLLNKIMLSLRDWGRDCWCASGKDNTCGNRFTRQFGSLPFGYDHKFVYSHFGYNLKATDMQAAVGVAQLQKLKGFVRKRVKNYESFRKKLSQWDKYFIFTRPVPNSEPSWFGFLVTLKDRCPFTRNDITQFLESHNIQTRNLFGGNMLRHPCFESLKKNKDYRVVGEMINTDKIMNDSFWVGVYPNIGDQQTSYIARVINEFIVGKTALDGK
jgi:Predicted pyridoxal phosphate-dependent enzyme apparently involved in regulation of cell wall biogenesis